MTCMTLEFGSRRAAMRWVLVAAFLIAANGSRAIRAEGFSAPTVEQTVGEANQAAEGENKGENKGAVKGPSAELLAPGAAGEVVVYAALDREFSEPILRQFERETGIRVLANYDVESTKTVGLTTRLLHEASRPRCDVFWNNELLHTVRLSQAGVLAAYESPRAADYPEWCLAPNRHWHCFAARARVILVNTDRMPDVADRPRSILELATDSRHRAAIAKPLFGTTATHATVLYWLWGEERASDFFRSVHARCRVMSGNKQVALAVASGQADWGLTDTDDAIIEVEAGRPVEIIFPDQRGEEGAEPLGAMRIPNTLALIRGGPNSENGKRLIDFLLSADVERQLARGPSAQFPLSHAAADTPSRAQGSHQPLWQTVDFAAAARDWELVSSDLQAIFATSTGLHPAGLALCALGGLMFAAGVFRLAPRGRLRPDVARVVWLSAGLILAVAGFWIAVNWGVRGV
ncbi:MAG: ABC transporter substrate-binding protein [Planctomycetales bacterium]|nr:ABC transporter substrate-binding protein [Planctomycetales bacterium]